MGVLADTSISIFRKTSRTANNSLITNYLGGDANEIIYYERSNNQSKKLT